jgi:FkbM family methyltransferase
MYVDRFRFQPGTAAFQRAERSTLQDLVDDYPRKLREIAGLLRRSGELVRAQMAFADSTSRATFRDLLVYRYLTPHLSSIANDARKHRELEAFMQRDYAFEPLPEKVDLLGQNLAVWAAALKGTPVWIATTKYGLYWALMSGQYDLHRGEVRIGAEKGDVILDCGAFLGETAVALAVDVGESGRIYSFDPFPPHIAIAEQVVARNGFEGRIELFTCGVGEAARPSAEAALGYAGHRNRLIASPGRRLTPTDAMISIDEFCRVRDLQKVDYIKMDIEGSELKALEGASETIARFRPKLAVCVYHRASDLWTIPLLLKSRYPFYRLYLEHYSLHQEETVLYAIADSR